MKPKKLLVLGLALAALAVGAYLVVDALAPPTRFSYGVYPVSEREAILLTRRNEDDATSFWVQLVSDDGALRWVHETTPLEVEEALTPLLGSLFRPGP